MNSPDINPVEAALARLNIPKVHLSDIDPASREHIGSGGYHTVYRVTMNGKESAFRINLHPDNPQFTQDSIEEVEGGYLLDRELPEVNEKLASSGSRVRLSCVTPTALVVDDQGNYVGSLAPIFDPTGFREIYPDEMYKNGFALDYELMLDRWQQLVGMSSTQNLQEFLASHLATEGKELESLEEEHKNRLKGSSTDLEAAEERKRYHHRISLEYRVKMQQRILKVIEEKNPQSVQEALSEGEYDVKSAQSGFDQMNLGYDIGEGLYDLLQRGYSVDTFGSGNVLGKETKDEQGRDIYLVHLYEVRRMPKEPTPQAQ